MGDSERTLREFEITAHGIEIGDPLTGMRGVPSGTPETAGARDDTGDQR